MGASNVCLLKSFKRFPWLCVRLSEGEVSDIKLFYPSIMRDSVNKFKRSVTGIKVSVGSQRKKCGACLPLFDK